MALYGPPIRTPMVDGNGMITREWLKFFQLSTVILNTSEGSITEDTIANLPTLTEGDAGALYYVTDYLHLLQWNGVRWQWGPGEAGSGWVSDFPAGRNPGSGWHVCDGSTVKVLNSDGTLTSITLPVIGNHGAFGNFVRYFRQ